MNKNIYSKIADALVADGYIVLENVLELEVAPKLLEVAKNIKEYKNAEISSACATHLDTNARRDKICWLDGKESAEAELLDFCGGLREYLNRELFLGLSYYESHFAVYEVGDFYEKHLDAFKNFKNRIVTTVYYLNESWNEADGGELIVYDEQNNFLKKVLPEGNTLVVFLSEKFPHEVLSSRKKRYSIAGWFRVDKV